MFTFLFRLIQYSVILLASDATTRQEEQIVETEALLYRKTKPDAEPHPPDNDAEPRI